MKLIILLAVVSCAYGAKLDRTYLPPNHAQTSGGSGNFLQAPLPSDFQRPNDYSQNENGFSQNVNDFSQNGNGYPQNGNARSYDDGVNGYNGNDFVDQPERPQAAFERNAAILRLDNENDGETYAYAYETENGIRAEENGVATNGVEAQGGFAYTGDDGQVYSIRYTAGQNGFMPEGEHLPTAPPVPEEILKALEQNARDEAAGIYDDGSYNEEKYENAANGYSYNDNSANNDNFDNYANSNINAAAFNGDEDTIVTNAARFTMANTQRSGPGNQGSSTGFRTQATTGLNEVNKAYLPPFASQGLRSRASSGNRNEFGSRSRTPSFNARSGYRY